MAQPRYEADHDGDHGDAVYNAMNSTQILELARAELTPKQFEAWELYYRAGWSYSKIAIACDVDRSTIQRRVQRAQWIMYEKLSEVA